MREVDGEHANCTVGVVGVGSRVIRPAVAFAPREVDLLPREEGGSSASGERVGIHCDHLRSSGVACHLIMAHSGRGGNPPAILSPWRASTSTKPGRSEAFPRKTGMTLPRSSEIRGAVRWWPSSSPPTLGVLGLGCPAVLRG